MMQQIAMQQRANVSLQQRMEMPAGVGSPLLGLSPLEVELLLDRSLEQVKAFHVENHHLRDANLSEEGGNYYWGGHFRDTCAAVKGKVSCDAHLETPQVLVEKRDDEYSSSYNTQIEQRIAEKLARFKREGEELPSPSKLFSKAFARERTWVVKQQLAIVQYLCSAQERYLQTGSPLDLKPISQWDVAGHIGYSNTSVSRLVRNLTIQLPDKRVLFADELIPGATTSSQQGVYALGRLRQDSALYEGGKWKVSDEALVPILRERFDLDVARRTVAKYRKQLESKE